MKDLKNKIAVVTGAASGIGLAMTEQFLQEGMKVVMADVEQGALEKEAKRLSEASGDERVLAVRTDVRDPMSVEQLRDAALERFGAVHVLCNNAGVGPAGPMLDTSAADWQWCTEVNVLGVAYGVITFGKLMAEQGEGHIINTASEAGLLTNATLGMYVATKHAVVGMTESLYRELEPQGVGVSVLCPSLINTGIFHSERNRDDGADMTPSQVATMAPLREAIVAMGLPPAKAATDVVEAIKENRFWIFTHEFTPGAAMYRFEDIRQGRNPSDPYAETDLDDLT